MEDTIIKFVKLTPTDSEVSILFRVDAIVAIAYIDSSEGAMVFTSNSDAGTEVNETPDEILTMIGGYIVGPVEGV